MEALKVVQYMEYVAVIIQVIFLYFKIQRYLEMKRENDKIDLKKVTPE